MALLELKRFEFEFSPRGIFRILDDDLDTVSRSQAKRRISFTHLGAFLEYLLLIYWSGNAQVDPVLRDLDNSGVPLKVEFVDAMRAGIENSPALGLAGLDGNARLKYAVHDIVNIRWSGRVYGERHLSPGNELSVIRSGDRQYYPCGHASFVVDPQFLQDDQALLCGGHLGNPIDV